MVALLQVHTGDSFPKQELASHYLLVYDVLSIFDSGRYSSDNLLFKKESNLVRKNVVSAGS
jgi:putative oxidoreductase